VSLELALDAIVAHRGRGAQCVGDVLIGDPREIARLDGVRRPNAGKAIGLQLRSDARALRSLPIVPDPIEDAEQVLDVMPVLVREHVGLRERAAGGPESVGELLEESEVDVHARVGGTVERADLGGGPAAGGRGHAGEEHGR